MTADRVATDSADGAQGPAAPPRRGPSAAPAVSTVRFVLLVAAIVATSVLVLLHIYTLVPANVHQQVATTARCQAMWEADPAASAPVVTDEDVSRATEARRRQQSCLSSVLTRQAVFVAAGVGLLFAVAIGFYLLQPWWLIRRRRLRRLSSTSAGRLLGDLEQLRQESGLSRSPDWVVAPFARTTGGQAFGRPWHRYVQIDAGLMVLRVTDRPAFRAIVLHELAHLRNRDVDKTYLTIGLWRAFVLVALLPYLVVMLHPAVLVAPLDWHVENVAFVATPATAAYRLGSLLLLVGLVYLTRNAILRVRELHADATAAAIDGDDSALPRVLGRLPAPAWWRRWGTHPHPRQRLAAIDTPGLSRTSGLGELAGVGIATGLVCSNVGFLVGLSFLVDARFATALVGLVVSSLAAGLLAIAVWSSVASAPARAFTVRTFVGYPCALVAGYLVGTFLTLRAAGTSDGLTAVSPLSRTIAILILAVGAVFLVAWIASTTRGVLAWPDGPRWRMPAVVAVAVIVGAVWFAVWLPASLIEGGFADGWGPPPGQGADIGWYQQAAAVSGVRLGPAGYLVYNPLTLPGLMLMWLVPVLARLPRRAVAPPIPLRPALIAAAVGAVSVAVVAAVLPLLAEAVLPAAVRKTGEGVPFYLIFDNVQVFIGAVAVAVVMTVVAIGRRTPHRPALSILAGCLTAVLSALILTFVTVRVSCYVNVWETSPAPSSCLDPDPALAGSARLGWMMVQAIVLAGPAILVSAVASGLLRGNHAPGGDTTAAATPSRPPWRFATVVETIVLVLLVVSTIWFSVVIAPSAYDRWFPAVLG